MQWNFSPKTPGEPTRDPISSEFFAADAIKNAAEALVREAIQNTLDARIEGARGRARVRIYVSGVPGALPAERHTRWFTTAWPHWLAPRNGLRSERLVRTAACRFLVYEDFETTGLIGDQAQYEEPDTARNPFFYFWRAEGATEKHEGGLGRWGIGKQVFPRSSQTQSLLGYSVTSSAPEGFLMGRCILKHHKVAGETYRPDGYYGVRSTDDGVVMPATDITLLDTFRRDFKIQRQPGQTGLSIVVPWVDDTNDEGDASEGFDHDSLLRAAISDYFIPILEGKLDVEIEDWRRRTLLSKDTFEDVLRSVEQNTDQDEAARMRTLIRIASAREGSLPVFTLGPCPRNRAGWSDSMLTPENTIALREALAAGQAVEVRASLTVRPKGAAETPGEVACRILRLDGTPVRPCYVREDLIVSGVRRYKVPGYVCLVRVPSGPLANMLGDSENPAHTEWQSTSRNFQGKYVNGKACIDFVTDLPRELLKRVHGTSRELDRRLLVDFFQDPGPEMADADPKPRKPTGPTGTKEPTPPKPQPRIEGAPELHQIVRGFRFSGADPAAGPGTRLIVKAAYKTTKGDPFKKFHSADFSFLSNSGIDVTSSGCTVTPVSAHLLQVRVTASTWSLEAKGFDEHRDLVVKFDRVRTQADEASVSPDSERAATAS